MQIFTTSRQKKLFWRQDKLFCAPYFLIQEIDPGGIKRTDEVLSP